MAITHAQIETPRIELGRARKLAGLSDRFTDETRIEIPELWKRFAQHMGRVSAQASGEQFGVCFRPRAGDEGIVYMAAMEVSEFHGLPEGFVLVEIPEQRYAVFAHRGHISELHLTCDAIWSQWAPFTNLKIKHGTADDVSFFELYDADFRPDPGIGHVEIWVPIL